VSEEDKPEPQDEPVLPPPAPATPVTALATIEKIEGVDGVLPESARLPLEELATRTGVNLLLGLIREGKAGLRTAEAKSLQLEQENKNLRDVSARAGQAERTRFAGPVMLAVGGVLAGAAGWPMPGEARVILAGLGLALIGVGTLLTARSNPSKLPEDR
jgi:hypothetical protein